MDKEHLDLHWGQPGADQQGSHTTGNKLLADSHALPHKAGAVEAFCQSARAGLVAPVEALGEIYDHAAGTHTADSMAKIAGSPVQTDGKLAWAASQIGSAVGMTPWMLLLHKGASAALTSASGVEALSAAQRIGVSATSGLAFGLALTPTGSNDKQWLVHRMQNGLASSLSFGALGGSTEILGAAGITNRAAAGILAGIPAGFADAGTRYATGQSKTFEPQSTMGTYAFIGGVFGVVSPYSKAPEVQEGQLSGTRTLRTKLVDASLKPAGATPTTADLAPRPANIIANPADLSSHHADATAEAAPEASAEAAALIPGKVTSGYTGHFLDDASIQRVQHGLKIDGQLVPIRWNLENDLHVTEQFGLNSTQGAAWADAAENKPATIKVVGHAVDNTGVEALVVTVDGQSLRGDGHFYHMTRSIADGRKASESITVVEKALALHQAQAEGRLADIKPEDAQRYSYSELKPDEQFALQTSPNFHELETTPKPEKPKPQPKPEVPFDSLTPQMQVVSALKSTAPEYLVRTIATRTPEQRAGSYFDMPPNQLREALFRARWEPYNPLDADGHPIITGGARGYRATIAGGRLGMTSTDTIGDTAKLYLIDPKGTGKWSVSTIGAAEPHTDTVTMIVGPDDASGKNVLWTFHPGEPVRASMLDSATLATLMSDAGLSADGLPESGTGRRIAITRSQLDQINAGLPDQAKMTLAKIESADNLPPGDRPAGTIEDPLQAIPNQADRVRFQRSLEALPVEMRSRYERALQLAVKNPNEVNRTTSVQGLTFEMSQLQRTLSQGLEVVSPQMLTTAPVSYQGYSRTATEFSQGPHELKKSTIQVDSPLERAGAAPYAYEVRSSPRMLYGTDGQQRNQILKYQQGIDAGLISGATIEVSGRISPDLVHWLNGKTVGDPSAAPDVEVLYSMPLPSGADYTFILKRAAGNNGLRFANDDQSYSAQDKRVIAGAYKAIQDRSIGDIISGIQIDNAPDDLAPHLHDPMTISDLNIFNRYDALRLQSIWDKLDTKADSDRINAANARNATSEYNTPEYLDEATRWYQDHLRQNPQSSKSKQAYMIASEDGIQSVVNRASERAQAIKQFELERAASAHELVNRQERAALGYSARPEGISLDVEHIIMDATAEENKSASRRGRSYDNPERFMTVDQVTDYLNGQDRHTIETQIYDPVSGESAARSNLSEKEVARTQTTVEAENLQRARSRVSALEQRYEELSSKTDRNGQENDELRFLTSRHNGWNQQRTAIQRVEGQIAEIGTERKAAGGQKKGPAPGQTKEAFIEQMQQRAAQYDARVAELNRQLQLRYQEVIGGVGEWNKIAKRVDVQHNNIIKFMYAVNADGTIPLTEEVLRGEVTGRAAHSELAQGRNVYGAGELVFVKDPATQKWVLSEINNASGHYRPPGADTLVYVRNLVQQAGVDTSRAILNDALQRGTPLVDAHLMDDGPFDPH